MTNEKGSDVLKKIQRAVKKNKTFEKGDIFRLIDIYPKRWLSHLLIGGIIPDPRNPETLDTILALLELLKNILSSPEDAKRLGEKHRGDLLGIITSLASLGVFYRELNNSLSTYSHLFKSVSVMVLRLGALLESQNYVATNHAKEKIKKHGLIDPISISQTDIIGDKPGMPKQSMGNVLEEQVECAELVLRYMLHTYLPVEGFGSCASAKIPYLDLELRKILSLSNIRRLLDDTWASIKYLGWVPIIENRITYYIPADKEEYHRIEAGKIRNNMINQQLGFRVLHAGLLFNPEEQETIRTAANSIKIPPACVLWDGRVDSTALRIISRTNSFNKLNDIFIEMRLYRSLLSGIRIPCSGGPALGWEEWSAGKRALLALALTLREAVVNQVASPTGDDCLQTVICTSRITLASILVNIEGFDPEKAGRVLEMFIFDQSRKKLEIWDQPLLPLGEDSLLVVPSLIISGEPTRCIENIIDQWGGNISKRGSALVEHIASQLDRVDGFLIEPNVKFPASDGREVEYDLIGFWQNRVILLEAKCLKSVHSPADEYRASREIDEAIEQLVRRRKLTVSDWDLLRAECKKLQLPSAPPSEGEIICIAVSNTTHFTGMKRDDVFVTDTYSFLRFFGNSYVEKQTVTEEGIKSQPTGFSLRTGALNPHKMLLYLADPPQVKLVKKSLGDSWLRIPTISDKSPLIALRTSEFSGLAKAFSESSKPPGKKRNLEMRKKQARKHAKEQRRKNRKKK